MSAAELKVWQEALDAVIAADGQRTSGAGRRFLNRAVVVAEALSTQDIARAHGEQAAGVVVATLRQTGGRGRLGRSWADTAELGVAVSMAVSVAVNVRGVEVLAQPGVLALLAGLGALRAVRSQHCTPEALGMKWPNDIVERSSGRKLGGVLIEQFGMLAVIGVGVNVLQRAANFPPELGDSAISILESDVAGGMQSGRVLKREDVAAAVVREVAAGLVQVCAEDGIEKLEREFAAADVLQGTTQTLVCDGLSYRGRVLSVEPLKQITIVTGQGTRVLPATKTQVERFQRPVKTGKLR